MLTGRVRHDGLPLSGALVTLSAHTGEVRSTTRTNAEGRYRLRLPPPGHNILTVLDPETLDTQSTKIFTTTQSAVADVDLESAASESDVPAQ